MAINFTPVVEDGILIVVSSGFDKNLEETKSFNQKVLHEAKRLDCRKVLSDERNLVYNLSLFETHQLGQNLANNIEFIEQIAVVVDKNQHETAVFWENVTYNRGVESKVFLNVESAMNWLRNSKINLYLTND
jgi:hypothetical protein